MKKLGLLITSICLVLAFVLVPVANLGTISAEESETLTVAGLKTKLSDQNITSTVLPDTSFNTNFDNSANWKTPAYAGTTILGDPFDNGKGGYKIGDLTSSGLIGYDDTTKFSDLGTDPDGGNNALTFILKESGVAGIETDKAFTVPAKANYALTFNVKIGKLANSGSQIGLNAKIIDGDKIYSMDKIQTVSNEYQTFAFLIQGNEYTEKTLKLQFLFGNATKTSDTTSKTDNQIGYAVVDTIKLYSVTNAQFNQLKSDSKKIKEVSLIDQNSNYIYVDNGYFNIAENQIWDVENSTKLSDFRPANWTQTGSTGTDFGIVNTNSTTFGTRITKVGIASAINPGNSDGVSAGDTNNNVLMLNNKEAGTQTIKSSDIILAKNGYFEISFKFNTPFITDETNKLSFYLTDKTGKTIYKKENVLSYTESNGANNEWAQFHVFIKTETAQTLNFIIKFGTETENSKGYAYIDDVRLTTKTSASTVMLNNEENKYVLKTDGEETQYLKKGTISFEDLEKLDQTKLENRSLSVYNYSTPKNENSNTNNNSNTNTSASTKKDETSNLSMLAYILPSVLFGACLIGGVAYFYIRKIKLPKTTRKTKTSYDRKKTLEKQIKSREDQEKKEQKIVKVDLKKSKKKNSENNTQNSVKENVEDVTENE